MKNKSLESKIKKKELGVDKEEKYRVPDFELPEDAEESIEVFVY